MNRNSEALKMRPELFSRLDHAIERYNDKKEQEQSFESLKELLQLFLTDKINEKKNPKILDIYAKQVLDIFAENPDYLKWAEDVALMHAKQPIIGWYAISTMLLVAQAQEIGDKLEAAKAFMILKKIESMVNIDTAVVEADKAEAFSAMFRKIHDLLHENGRLHKTKTAAPWPGVDTKDHDDDHKSIEDWLGNNEVIERFKKEAIDILSLNPRDTADELLSEHLIIWSKLAFPEIAKEVEEKHVKEIKSLEGKIQSSPEEDPKLIEALQTLNELLVTDVAKESKKQTLAFLPSASPSVAKDSLPLWKPAPTQYQSQ